jgi:hypothetical protein
MFEYWRTRKLVWVGERNEALANQPPRRGNRRGISSHAPRAALGAVITLDYSLLQVQTVLPFKVHLKVHLKQHVLERAKRPVAVP